MPRPGASISRGIGTVAAFAITVGCWVVIVRIIQEWPMFALGSISFAISLVCVGLVARRNVHLAARVKELEEKERRHKFAPVAPDISKLETNLRLAQSTIADNDLQIANLTEQNASMDAEIRVLRANNARLLAYRRAIDRETERSKSGDIPATHYSAETVNLVS